MLDPTKTTPNGGEEDFDWVTARHRCSGANMFHQLRLEVEQNIKARNDVCEERQEREKFDFNVSGEKFSVSRGVAKKMVDFTLKGDSIFVSGNGLLRPFVGTVTLGEPFGFCRLRVDGIELSRWQFLRMALEDLFFKEWAVGQ